VVDLEMSQSQTISHGTRFESFGTLAAVNPIFAAAAAAVAAILSEAVSFDVVAAAHLLAADSVQ